MKTRKLALRYFGRFGEIAELYYSRRTFAGEHGRWIAKFTEVIPGLPIGYHDPNRGIPGVSFESISTADLKRA